MDRNKKKYFGNAMSFNELLETISCNDVQFYYKGRAYNITMHKSPCITVLDEGDDVWENCMKNYETYEQLLLKHTFEDGVPILEALQDYKNIELY